MKRQTLLSLFLLLLLIYICELCIHWNLFGAEPHRIDKSWCPSVEEAYGIKLVRMQKMVIDPSSAYGPLGGEKMDQAWGRSEFDGLVQFNRGFLTFRCDEAADWSGIASDSRYSALNRMLRSSVFRSSNAPCWFCEKDAYKNKTVVLVSRIEYVNLFHTITDWYNVFLVLHLYDVPVSQVHVLFVDSHAIGSLDSVWKTLFNEVSRLADYRVPKNTSTPLPLLTNPLKDDTHILYLDRVLAVGGGYGNPLFDYGNRVLEKTEEFREFMLYRHGLSYASVELNSKPTILFVSRKNYIPHTGKPSGSIARQMSNEEEVVEAVKNSHLFSRVTIIRLEMLSMYEQLQLSSKSDVLVGIHGAALTHALFLNNNSALIEIIPHYCCSSLNYFMKLAAWRGLYYRRLYCSSSSHVGPELTQVDPSALITILEETVDELRRRRQPEHL